MKTMKKIASLALALILTVALAAPAMAAEVTINQPEGVTAEETYKAYKIFDAAFETGSDMVLYTIADNSPFFTVIRDFGETPAFKLTEKSTENGVTTYYVEAAQNFEAAALSEALMAVENKGSVIESDANKLILGDGYFLIVGSLGSKAILDTFGKGDISITTKNEKPTVEKETRTLEGLKIGDKVPYTVTIHAKPGAANYVFHDKMGEGLTYGNDLTIEGLTEGDGYTVSQHTGEGAHNGFDVTFTKTYLDSITTATDIVLTYSATINANATLVVDTTTNKAVLDYGDNNHTEESNATKVEIELYSFDLVKTTSSNTVLDGANFSLYGSRKETVEGVETAVIDYDNRITLAADGKVDPNGAENFNAGKVTIYGLSAGTYFLEENTAPEGYNKVAEPIKVELTATNSATVTEGTGDAPDTYVSGGVQVVNYTGAEMPSTGGIGTTIFYVVGGLLAVGAGVLLVTKRRMSGEEE